ncbi:sulfotransferase family protein (plasmid) [Roseobacteraceae bacterium NS-SX3]
MLDFLGIGAQKAGTSWLMGQLKQHPDIIMPPVGKEVHYFDVVHGIMPHAPRMKLINRRICKRLENIRSRPSNKKRILKASWLEKLSDESYVFTESWYRDLFSNLPAGKKSGEITPNYSALPVEGILHIKEMMPDVPVIYIIRDPFDRAVSSLRMMAGRPGKNPELILGDAGYWARGDYASNVTRWDKYFGGNILYIPFGDIRKNPSSVIKDVEAHVGLSSFSGYTRIDRQVNSSASKDFLVTDGMKDVIRQRVQDQYDFIERRFGKDFVSRIK